MSTARSARIADQIQRELAEVIRLELRDPRVGLVTLTGVELSRDQSHAKVFFTVLGSQAEDAQSGLANAAGFLRSELARRLTTRKVPELHFAYDESVERGIRISHLIDEALKPPANTIAGKPRARKPRKKTG
jgi:ribosome-binding factor A